MLRLLAACFAYLQYAVVAAYGERPRGENQNVPPEGVIFCTMDAYGEQCAFYIACLHNAGGKLNVYCVSRNYGEHVENTMCF